jgi:hypothetical protein
MQEVEYKLEVVKYRGQYYIGINGNIGGFSFIPTLQYFGYSYNWESYKQRLVDEYGAQKGEETEVCFDSEEQAQFAIDDLTCKVVMEKLTG